MATRCQSAPERLGLTAKGKAAEEPPQPYRILELRLNDLFSAKIPG